MEDENKKYIRDFEKEEILEKLDEVRSYINKLEVKKEKE